MSNQLAKPTTFSEMMHVCSTVAHSQIIPLAFRSRPEEMLACWMTGMEFGWGLMRSLRSIHVIRGVASLAPEAMLGLILEAGHTVDVKYIYDDDGNVFAVEVAGKRADNDAEATETFTIKDAEQAKLTTKDNWKMYPKNMLRWRAVSNLASTLFTDVIQGASYIPEELGAHTDMNGEPIHTTHTQKLQELAPHKAKELNGKYVLQPAEIKEVSAQLDFTEHQSKIYLFTHSRNRLKIDDKANDQVDLVRLICSQVWRGYLEDNKITDTTNQLFGVGILESLIDKIMISYKDMEEMAKEEKIEMEENKDEN